MTYHNSPDGKLSQGDILHHVTILKNIVNRSGNDAKFGEANVLVITRNCELDKPNNIIFVARINRLAGQDAFFQRVVRGETDEEVVNTFHLPPDGQLMQEESYVDWRTLQPADKAIMKQFRRQQDHYVCTLDEEMRTRCLESFIVFFTKPDDEEI